MLGANSVLLHTFRFQMRQAQDSAGALGEFFQTRQFDTSGLMTKIRYLIGHFTKHISFQAPW
jgi:hypothetical protein